MVAVLNDLVYVGKLLSPRATRSAIVDGVGKAAFGVGVTGAAVVTAIASERVRRGKRKSE